MIVMPASLRTHLFFSFLAILVFGMVVAGLLAWRSVEDLYLDTQRENLLAQASLTASALQGQPLSLEPAQSYMQTANVAPGIHTRLLSDQGVVLIGLPIPSSAITAPPVENSAPLSPAELLARAEIAQALQGFPAAAIRRVTAAGNRKVLYAAAPVFGADGDVHSLVYLASPLPQTGLPLEWLFALVGAVLAAVILASLAGTLIARRVARPMQRLAQAAAAVSDGDLSPQVPIENSIHELNSLGKAFNQMTESLRQSAQAKNAFVADVNHELRTPLTVIKGTLETLEDGAIDDLEGRGPLLASVQRETDRLIRLVNDLLILTRADAGTLNLQLQPLDLGAIVRARCEHLAPLAARRQVTFSVHASPASCVLGDADRLAQILDNLLDNAIRFSPEGAVIEVTVRPNGNAYICAVCDHGPGIPQKHLPMLFERFYRADASRNRQTGGAGLGLAIARALVVAQGGHIGVESVEGKGTTVYFFLPASADCLPTA